MARKILTGDWHVQKGIKTNILINYLKYLQLYCLEENIKDIYVLGDIVERSSSIKNEAFIPLFQQLYLMKNSGINFTIIIGNHDAFNKNNDSIIEVLSPIANVVKDVLVNEEEAFVSYTKEESIFSSIDPIKVKYLFTHVPIANFSFDSAFHATEKHSFREELFEEFTYTFTGHFHRHQSRKNIVYVGSPFQMNFGEMGQDKGFVVFDQDMESWEFIKYSGPEYIKFHVSEFKNYDVENKFVGVIVDTKIQNYIKLKRILFEKGAIDVIPFFEKKEETIDFKDDNEGYNAIPDIIKDFLKKIKKENINNDNLLEKFERVLNEV
jgi:DNA repair exonuclease SbcCD nuclease subunit